MQSFIIQHHVTLIIDATHPYAVLVSENIKKAAEREHVKYVRIIRQANESVPGVVYFDDIEGVITYINKKPAKTLVTTGSKELAAFTKVDCYQKNIYARVLPIETIRKQCIANGFDQEHIIGKQGPFSVEENMEQIIQSGAEYLVTKDTGIEGGFPQKCLAAQQMGIQLLVIKRQGKESGITVEQLQDFMDRGGIWEEL